MAEYSLADILRFSYLMIEHFGENAIAVAENQFNLSDDDSIKEVWRGILSDVCLLVD